MSAFHFGIVAFGHALGEAVQVEEVVDTYTENVSKVLSWGYKSFRVAPETVGLTDLAYKAGKQALANADVQPEQVDLIVLAISDLPEYLYWDPAAKLQGMLGAKSAEAILLDQACVSGVMSFDAIAGKLAVHPRYNTVLLVAGNRAVEAYQNRMETNTCISSDGSVAAVIKRGHDRLTWLNSEVITDGTYADLFRYEYGGAAKPISKELLKLDTFITKPMDVVAQFFDRDPRKLMEFIDIIHNRVTEVIEKACQRAGVTVSDLKKVIYLNDNEKEFRELSKHLLIPLEKTNFDLSVQYGHMGSADQLLALAHYLKTGELEEGDLVAIAALGSGMHWACTLLRV